MLTHFRQNVTLFFLIFICIPLFAQEENTELDSILPFHWEDTPEEMISHLRDLGVQFVNGGSNDEPIESPSVPFLGYRAKIRAQFSGSALETLTFTLEEKGPQEGLFFIYNDIDNQLRNYYGKPHGMNLLSREVVWRSTDRNRALWSQMVLEKTDSEKTEGTLQGSIALRGSSTADGKQSSSSAILDVSGVKFALDTAVNVNYKMTIQVTFQNMAPGQSILSTKEQNSQEEAADEQQEENTEPAQPKEEQEAPKEETPEADNEEEGE